MRYSARSEIIVEKIALPPDVRKGQPFDLRIVVNNTNKAAADEPGVVGGTLRVLERTSDQPVELSSQHVDLPPGKSVFTVRQQIDKPDFYTYEAQFIPDDPAADAMSQNNPRDHLHARTRQRPGAADRELQHEANTPN